MTYCWPLKAYYAGNCRRNTTFFAVLGNLIGVFRRNIAAGPPNCVEIGRSCGKSACLVPSRGGLGDHAPDRTRHYSADHRDADIGRKDAGFHQRPNCNGGRDTTYAARNNE